jgi:hypothetical protein
MKALLSFTSDFLRNHVQLVLNAHNVPTQSIDSQLLQSEFFQAADADFIITDEFNVSNILNNNNLSSCKILVISGEAQTHASIYRNVEKCGRGHTPRFLG